MIEVSPPESIPIFFVTTLTVLVLKEVATAMATPFAGHAYDFDPSFFLLQAMDNLVCLLESQDIANGAGKRIDPIKERIREGAPTHVTDQVFDVRKGEYRNRVEIYTDASTAVRMDWDFLKSEPRSLV